MTGKTIKKIAFLSYSRNELDSKKVNRVVKYLNRRELKNYIKALKNYENKKNVTLVTADAFASDVLIKELKKIFPEKNILPKQDKSLIAGIRIIDNDTVYDFNIKNTLGNLVSYITQ